jgi:hypothetical protein
VLPPLHHANANPFALLQDDDLDGNVDNITDSPSAAAALSVLDHDTGKFLEHRQLCQDPKHKATWDRSYANKIGRLCQGIGKHPTKPNT